MSQQRKSQNSTRNNNSEDEQPSRVDQTHGGEVVEAIAPEDLVSVHDSNCTHENMVRDESEKDFNAFICANPNCAEVAIVAKV